MIRLVFHSLFNIGFKLILLIVIVNLLFHYFESRPLDWPTLGDLEVLPEKFLGLVKDLVGWIYHALP
jgi:hypothetical protein